MAAIPLPVKGHPGMVNTPGHNTYAIKFTQQLAIGIHRIVPACITAQWDGGTERLDHHGAHQAWVDHDIHTSLISFWRWRV